jgi:hypothetical protein
VERTVWFWMAATRKLWSVNNGKLRNDTGQISTTTRYTGQLDI